MRMPFRTGMSPVLLAFGFFLIAAACPALEFGEVLAMQRGGVPEVEIIGRVRASTWNPISLEQANLLRAAGAGEALIGIASVSHRPAAGPRRVESPAPRVVSPAGIPGTPIAGQGPSGSPVLPLGVMTVEPPPPLCEKEGWLSISNTDWTSYFLNIDVPKKRLFLSRVPNGGGMEIEPGRNLSLNIRKETYKLYGDSGRKLEVKVREGEGTHLTLVPFGVVGNSGLNGVVRDRDRTRNEVLFDNFMPPPAVIVANPPVVVTPGPYHAPYYYAPAPRRHYGGFGYGFGFGW